MIAPISPSDCDGLASSRKHNLKSNLRNSIRDGGCWGAMVGLGENYIPAFALAAGLSEVTAGGLLAFPFWLVEFCRRYLCERSLLSDPINAG